MEASCWFLYDICRLKNLCCRSQYVAAHGLVHQKFREAIHRNKSPQLTENTILLFSNVFNKHFLSLLKRILHISLRLLVFLLESISSQDMQTVGMTVWYCIWPLVIEVTVIKARWECIQAKIPMFVFLMFLLLKNSLSNPHPPADMQKNRFL